MKKLIAVVLILALTIPAGGCGKSKTPKPAPSPTPIPKSQVSIGLPGLKPSVSGKPSGAMQQLFIDKFGIEFVPWQPTQSDWEASIKAAAAANSLPDVFSQGAWQNWPLFKQLVDQKRVRDIPESVFKSYQNLGAAMYRYAKTESLNGKMYFVPRADMARQYANGNSVAIYYRLDWAMSGNVFTIGQTPNWKQFMDLMSYYSHNDPDKNGSDDTFGLTCGGPGLGGLKTAFLMTFGVRDWVVEGNKWIPGVLSERAENAVKWASQAYRTGCVDPTFATQTTEDAVNKFCSGKAGMLVYDASPAGAAHIAAVLQVKSPGVDVSKAVSVLPQPTDPWGVSYNEDVSYSTGTFFSASVSDSELRKIFTLMDWLYTDEAFTYAYWGQKGTDYNATGSGYQTLHKGANNLPVTFGDLNTEWSAMATLSTWGRDYISDPQTGDYRQKFMDTLKETWWTNNWRKPLFTRYIMDNSVRNFDSDGKAEAALADMVMKSANIDKDWPNYVTQMTGALNVAAVEKVVNDYAQQHKITAEE